MPNLTIELPDDLARSLQAIAADQQKTVEELAIERLRSLVDMPSRVSRHAVLKAMLEPPHPSSLDVDALDAEILAGRKAIAEHDIF